MSLSDEKLKTITDQLKQGVVPSKETVRSFLRWFYAERRGYNVVWRIRQALKKHSLVTVPDFEFQYIDGLIGFSHSATSKDVPEIDIAGDIVDPTYRLGRLDAANKTPVSVKPDASLQQAVTLMMTNDFSQLPVMTTVRDLKGVISWKSIGKRLALKRPCAFVRECMDTGPTASLDESLFTAMNAVAEHEYVIVISADKTICGIVTASDFNDQFRRLAEPFLLVGEVEHGVRGILHGKFTAKELEEAKSPGDDGRAIKAISDLTFGEYIHLIQEQKKWEKLEIEIDRVEFISRLNKVREIRNDVMHFDPDGLEPSDLTALREFAAFLKMLRELGAV